MSHHIQASVPVMKLTRRTIMQGLTPTQISPKEGAEAFWSELLSLDVDRTYLSERLTSLPKGDCLERLKVRRNRIVAVRTDVLISDPLQ